MQGHGEWLSWQSSASQYTVLNGFPKGVPIPLYMMNPGICTLHEFLRSRRELFPAASRLLRKHMIPSFYIPRSI